MSKRFIQYLLEATTPDSAEEAMALIREYSLSHTGVLIERWDRIIRLSSNKPSDINDAAKFLQSWKKGTKERLALLYRSPKQAVGQQAMGVEPTEPYAALSFWLSLELNDNPEENVIVQQDISSDVRTVLADALNGLFHQTPTVGVKLTLSGYTADEGVGTALIAQAAVDTFESAFSKSNPVTMEPVMSMIIKVKEERLADTIAFVNRQRGLIEALDETGDLKILKALLPLSELLAFEAEFIALAEGGSFDYVFKKFSARPTNVK